MLPRNYDERRDGQAVKINALDYKPIHYFLAGLELGFQVYLSL